MKTISFLAVLMFFSFMAFAGPRKPVHHLNHLRYDHGHRPYRPMHHRGYHRHYAHRYGHHPVHGRLVHHPHHAGMRHKA